MSYLDNTISATGYSNRFMYCTNLLYDKLMVPFFAQGYPFTIASTVLKELDFYSHMGGLQSILEESKDKGLAAILDY